MVLISFIVIADLPQSKWKRGVYHEYVTNPKYRRLGIAYKTLDMLIRDTKGKEFYVWLWKETE